MLEARRASERPVPGSRSLHARGVPLAQGPDASAPLTAMHTRLWAPRAAAARLSLFSLKAPQLPSAPDVSAHEALTHAAAARERLEDARTQALTSAGLGAAGLLTSGLLRLIGAPTPHLPPVLGLRMQPLDTLPLSFSVQGSLP